ncbi:type II toxin-antitoxin system VapC family toxin [Prosthecobacter sp.]|uniref:type II toxin-antitoxin system VapC family toxin n=1 Tax=Prosthecobacter sp. TaxID=1965333 RepID=UPI0024879DB2|nr:type II toxin-antitoxin system VapC family toxin [Prosthecobacter sp.]MDI1312020.1 type II toxin-antitoxin system VapC family toxin [Prosthecobacter sp.]
MLKLLLAEADSTSFVALAARSAPLVTAFIARHEAQAAFFRRESENALPVGEADLLYQDMLADIANGDIVEIPLTSALEAEYGAVLRRCLLHSPPVFVRTNDALHLASAKLAGEQEFISADIRQRAAALHLGFTVLP